MSKLRGAYILMLPTNKGSDAVALIESANEVFRHLGVEKVAAVTRCNFTLPRN